MELNVNQLLGEVDHLIRNLVPCFFEAAGIKREADALRKLPSVTGGRGPVGLCRKFLHSLTNSVPDSVRDPYWRFMVSEVTFWAEAALATAETNETSDCLISVFFVKRTMDEAWDKFVEH